MPYWKKKLGPQPDENGMVDLGQHVTTKPRQDKNGMVDLGQHTGRSRGNWTIQGDDLTDPLIDPLAKKKKAPTKEVRSVRDVKDLEQLDDLDPFDIPLPPEALPEPLVEKKSKKPKTGSWNTPGPRPDTSKYREQPSVDVDGVDTKMSRIDQPLWDEHGPQVSDVRQGELGDCFFLATVAAIVANSPDYIKDMIQVDDDDKFRVRIYTAGKNPQPQWIAVDHKLPVDKLTNEMVFAKPKETENIWAPIIEKAYAKSRGGYDKIDEGGYGQNTAVRLLARRPETVPLDGDPKVAFEKVASALEGRNAVTVEKKKHVVSITDVDRTLGKLKVNDQEGDIDWMSISEMDKFGYLRFLITYIPKKDEGPVKL